MAGRNRIPMTSGVGMAGSSNINISEEQRSKHELEINRELARMKYEDEMQTPEYRLFKKRLENQQEAYREIQKEGEK